MAESHKETPKVVVTPAGHVTDIPEYTEKGSENMTGGACIDTPAASPSSPSASANTDFGGLEGALLGREKQDSQNVLQTFKKVQIMAAIRRGGDQAYSDSESDTLETDDSEPENSLLGDEMTELERGLSETALIRQKSDVPIDMPQLLLHSRPTLQRNDSLVNVYRQQLLASGDLQVWSKSEEDDSDDASMDNGGDFPDWISSLPAKARSSMLKFAADAVVRRSRAQTTEELQEHYKLTTEQAEDVIELANKPLVHKIEKKEKKEPEDIICKIELDNWKPVDASFVYPVFEKKKNQLTNLKISGEFFRYLRRGFTEKKMLVETELPNLQKWNEKTWKLFAFKERNRVTDITEALASALQSTEVLRDFLEYSCIILDEPVGSDSKFVQFGDPQFGSRTFTLGKHSILNARCLFSFTSQKFTFRDDVWEEALDTSYPGRQLMMEPVYVAPGVEKRTAQATRSFDSLQRLHNLFISDYIKSLQIVDFQTNLRSRGKRCPLEFDFSDLYRNLKLEKKMSKPLKDAFGSICYCVNPDPGEHMEQMLHKHKSLKRCRMLCDSVGWLHSLVYLLDQRIFQVFRVDTAIRNWLAKKKPKKANSKKKSKVRLAVEELLKSLKKELAQLKDMMNLLPKKSQFEDLYEEEDRLQKEEMLRLAKTSTNASKRLSKTNGKLKTAPPERAKSRSKSPDAPGSISHPPPPSVAKMRGVGEKLRGPRQSKLEQALKHKRQLKLSSLDKSRNNRKKKVFSLGARQGSEKGMK